MAALLRCCLYLTDRRYLIATFDRVIVPEGKRFVSTESRLELRAGSAGPDLAVERGDGDVGRREPSDAGRVNDSKD